MNVLKNYSNVYGLYSTLIKYKQCLFITITSCLSESIYAADTLLTPENAIGVSEYLKVLLGLIFVIGLFFTTAYLYKRFGHGPMAGRGHMRIVDGLHLGNRERLVLVDLNSKQILLAITPGQIRKLDTIDAPLEKEGSFPAVLEQANTTNKTRDMDINNA